MTFDVTTNVSDEESYILLILEHIYAKIVLSWILLSLSGGFHIIVRPYYLREVLFHFV